jgi:GTPase Era involved in 16S rRNA processing
MIRRTFLILLCLILSASAAYTQDDVMEKIRLLEQQIQELKALKQQQAVTEIKMDHCMKAVAREKFCTCVSDKLPREVSFEQYVHTLVTTREKLGYDAMTAEQKKVVDATIAVRETCVEKGFFK